MKICAINSNKEAQVRPTESFGGLRDTLHLSPGCRIILTTSVDNDCGLSNGATGAAIALIYKDGDGPHARTFLFI